MKCPPIIIIGMHRSGTTMLSKILEQLGVFMGWRKEENNEALFFLKFNDWILKQVNATWDNPYNYTVTKKSFKDLMVYLAEKYIKSVRRVEYLGILKSIKYKTLKALDFPWGWKDPRNTFTLDIWIKIFPNAKIIHIYRNPIDVAESLRKRVKKLKENFKWNWKKELKLLLTKGYIVYKDSQRVENIYEGIKLWEEYINRVFELEKNFNLKILHIKYEDFLEKPFDILKQILNFVDMQVEDAKIKNSIQYIRSDRRYAFLKNANLVQIYKSVKDNELIHKLRYGNLI